MPRTPVTPLLTVDVVIELTDRPGRPIVLVARKYSPPGWALAGGFVDVGETLEAAACREAHEETGLTPRLTALLGCYSDPRRDARGHSVSVVYIGEAQGTPAADDAKAVGVFAPEKLPDPLAFDHARILRDYLNFRERGIRPNPHP